MVANKVIRSARVITRAINSLSDVERPVSDMFAMKHYYRTGEPDVNELKVV